jgi:CRISPR system Cascade subunit CasB
VPDSILTRDDELKAFVSKRIGHLYASSRSGGTSAGVLSNLRKRTTPGANPATWEATLGLSAPLAGRGDIASPYEKAAHAALSLYAVHQQSKSDNMHSQARSFGTAVRALSTAPGRSEQAVIRRFRALATSRTIDGVMVHARGLISQMRGASITFDYADFAADLRNFQSTADRNKATLTWGRDLNRAAHSATNPATTDPTD